MKTPITKPRTPLYLRQNGPHPHDTPSLPLDMKFKEASDWLRANYQQYMDKFRGGSFCRCKTCGWFGRERRLGHAFVSKQLRAIIYCPLCANIDIEYFDNLTPAQEALLEP